MITDAKARKYLLEKYPQSQQEAQMLGLPLEEEPEEPYQINIKKTQGDPQRKVFVKALFQMQAIYDKVDVLQRTTSDYETYCLRLYWQLTYNWNHAPNVKSFREVLRDSDIYEIVEASLKSAENTACPPLRSPTTFYLSNVA